MAFSFNTLKSLFNISGGLTYHYTAMKYEKKLWQDFNNSISYWLEQWPFDKKEILLIAPSAGYSLNSSFLSQFDNIIYNDPDSIAFRIFKHKYKKSIKSIQRDKTNYFNFNNNKEFEFNKNLFDERYKNTPILICNFVGQIPLLFNDKTWQPQFLNLLCDKKFATYFDLYSYKAKRLQKKVICPVELLSPNTFLKKLSSYYKLKDNTTIVDHLTKDLFPDNNEGQNFLWQIRPDYHHIIKGIYNTK